MAVMTAFSHNVTQLEDTFELARVRLGQVLRAHTSLLLTNGTNADICEELQGAHQVLRKDLSLLALLV